VREGDREILQKKLSFEQIYEVFDSILKYKKKKMSVSAGGIVGIIFGIIVGVSVLAFCILVKNIFCNFYLFQ